MRNSRWSWPSAMWRIPKWKEAKKPRQALPCPRSMPSVRSGPCRPPIISGSLERVPVAKSLRAKTRTKWLATRSMTPS